MSVLVATQITAIATAVLAAFAIVTALFALLAFRKQALEVETLQQEAIDQQELTRQQGELLKIQSRQLELQSRQFEEQSKVNAEQAEMFDLQAKELTESLAQRKREAEERRRDQASKIKVWVGRGEQPGWSQGWGAFIWNDSDLPVVAISMSFHYVSKAGPGGEWQATALGDPIDIKVLGAHVEFFAYIPDEALIQMAKDHETNAETYVVSIEFDDAAGNRWERDPRGALVLRG